MKNNFQSKAVPRGIRTIWRYLSALFILFTFAIGNVWAADDIYYVAMVQNVAEDGTLSGTSGTLKVVKYTASTGKYAETDAVGWSLSSPSVGCKGSSVSKCSDISDYSKWQQGSGSQKAKGPKFSGTTTLSLGSLTATKITFIGYRNNSGSGGTLQVGTGAAKTTVKRPSSTFGSDCVVEYTGSFTGNVSVVASHEHAGVFVITVPATAPTNYTVTIDPNGGAYAEDPDGWTKSAGVYTKSIASGTSFTAPAGLTKGTDDLTWKDGADNVVTFPVTISDDITFVAQWAPHAASSDATLSALSVAGLTLNETFDPATTAYTANLPFYGVMPTASAVTATKNDSHASDPVVSVSGNVISVEVTPESGAGDKKTYTITVNIADAPTASSSINIEQLVLDNSTKYNIGDALDAAHIAYVDKDALDSLKDQSGRNEPYLGLKFKKSSSKITVVVPAEKVLNIKWGNISTAIKVKINGESQSDITTTPTGSIYHLDAANIVRQVEFSVAADKKTIVLKQVMVGEDIKTVTLPWLVTYDAGEHGTCAKAKETWKGSALTLPAVTPESGWDFDGWFTAASAGTKVGDAGDSYTPTADVELFAQYTAQASPFDLTALTYQIGSAAAENVGYVDGTFTYNIELPYKPSYDAITVAPTLKVGTSYLKGDEVLTVSSLPGAATFTVVENGGANEQLYTVNFTKAPKDGICLIKGNVGNDTFVIDEEASLLSGTADKDNVRTESSTYDTKTGWKFNARPARLGITLSGAETFQAGDIVEVFVTTVANISGANDKMRIFDANEGTSAHLLVASEDDLVQGANRLVLPTTSTNSLYLHRTKDGDYDNFNPYVAYVAVYRAMNPVLTAITFDGVDADQDSEFAFSATLPQGTNLGTMTVTPTIVWNGAGSVAPTAAWAWGDNTYRVTDKDGDYTDYTITLTEALAPSADPTITTQPAGANYYEGATIAALEVVATGSGDLSYQWYLGSDEIDGATAATYTPTVSAIGTYVYHCVVTNTEAGHPATSLASDEATITISEDPAAIKLLNGSTVNHTNFITGVTADETVEFMGNTVNYAKFSGTVGGVNGVKDLTRVIAYNATTTQTKIKVSVHNNSTNARSCYVKGLVEGADAAVDLATISLTNKEDKISDWITFDNAANRTIYIFVSSDAGDVYFTQVKVIESGTDLKMAGEAGYSLNFDHGRFFGVKDATAHFEELDVEVRGSDCQSLNTSVVKLANSSIIFDVTAPVTLTVTTNNNKTYYVTKGSAGTDNETAKTGATEFSLTAGTWYITGGSSNVEITNIAFAAPKCEQPTITPTSNSDLCEGDDFAPLTVSATVSDEGTLHYAWFKEAGETDEAVGTDAASYTPEADGEYYVIVTNRKDGFSDNSATSNTVTVTHYGAPVITSAPLNKRGEVDDVVTLTVAATGKNVAYEWFRCDNEAGENPVAFEPAETGTSLNVTITAGMEQWYKVLVTSDCNNTFATAKVSEFQPTTPASVTTSILWDWTSSVWPASGTAAFANEDAPDYELLADAGAIVPNAEGFRSDMLYGKGQYVWRSSDPFFQGSAIKFTSTVAGMVRVYFRSTKNGRTVNVAINGTDAGSRTNSFGWSEYVEVPAGEVEILCTGDGYTRIQKIEFLEIIDSRTEYAAKDLGTACYKYDALVIGATAYMIAGINESGYIVFDEIGELEAGKPYLFEADGGKIFFCKPIGVTAAPLANGEEITVKGMVGTFTGTTLTQGADDLCYFSGRHLWRVNDFGVDIEVEHNRCYVNYDVLKAAGPASAPAAGRRRVTMGINGKDATQGFENILGGDQPMKVMIDGTLYIIRGEKVFDATGRLVK